jgi:hypothetical protein
MPGSFVPIAVVAAGSGGAPDSITVRYFEDRYHTPPLLQAMTFSIAAVDGASNLFRRQGAVDEPAVEGVTNLIGYRHRRHGPAQRLAHLPHHLGVKGAEKAVGATGRAPLEALRFKRYNLLQAVIRDDCGAL